MKKSCCPSQRIKDARERGTPLASRYRSTSRLVVAVFTRRVRQQTSSSSQLPVLRIIFLFPQLFFLSFAFSHSLLQQFLPLTADVFTGLCHDYYYARLLYRVAPLGRVLPRTSMMIADTLPSRLLMMQPALTQSQARRNGHRASGARAQVGRRRTGCDDEAHARAARQCDRRGFER